MSGVGSPKLEIAQELLENLRALGCTWMQIARMLQAWRWTIRRRVVEYGLHCGRWSDISDYQLDTIRGYISRHGVTTGQFYIIGYVRSLEYLDKESMNKEVQSKIILQLPSSLPVSPTFADLLVFDCRYSSNACLTSERIIDRFKSIFVKL